MTRPPDQLHRHRVPALRLGEHDRRRRPGQRVAARGQPLQQVLEPAGPRRADKGCGEARGRAAVRVLPGDGVDGLLDEGLGAGRFAHPEADDPALPSSAIPAAAVAVGPRDEPDPPAGGRAGEKTDDRIVDDADRGREPEGLHGPRQGRMLGWPIVAGDAEPRAPDPRSCETRAAERLLHRARDRPEQPVLTDVERISRTGFAEPDGSPGRVRQQGVRLGGADIDAQEVAAHAGPGSSGLTARRGARREGVFPAIGVRPDRGEAAKPRDTASCRARSFAIAMQPTSRGPFNRVGAHRSRFPAQDAATVPHPAHQPGEGRASGQARPGSWQRVASRSAGIVGVESAA